VNRLTYASGSHAFDIQLYTPAQAEDLRQKVMATLPQLCTLKGRLAALERSDAGREEIQRIRGQVLEAAIQGSHVFLTSEEASFENNYFIASEGISFLTDRIEYSEARITRACAQKSPF
jgi:hypothetical protein